MRFSQDVFTNIHCAKLVSNGYIQLQGSARIGFFPHDHADSPADSLLHAGNSVTQVWSCLAIHASAATDDRICVISLGVRLEVRLRELFTSRERVLSVLSFAVTVMLKSASCLVASLQERKLS